MPRLNLKLFGGFGANLDGEPENRFESNKVRALLAYLAVESAQPHNRSALAGLFWPEHPESRARQSLSQALYNLKHTLGENSQQIPFLHITHHTIQFNQISDHWLDVTAFSKAIRDCDTHPHSRSHHNGCDPCREQLTRAGAWYVAPFLQEFALKDSPPFEEWALLTRERLHRQALHAFQRLASLHEARGELSKALQYARRAVELDPLWEAAHRQVIHLLALSGQRTEAFAQYESLRLALATELGVEPEHETQRLITRLETASPNQTAPRPQHNLPASLTPFIGREDEQLDLAARLRDPDCRLITVLGPGGSGKTRFAVETARGLLDAFPNGVWFVSLAAVTTQETVIPALVQGLGLYPQEDTPPEKQLQNYLREKCLLLVLDNYEQLLPEVNWLVQILQAARQVKVLVTSRMALNVKGEHRYPLAGLSVPKEGETLAGARHSAVRLFADAAERARPGFRLTSSNLPAIVEICRTVAGMPLGVILAAAWVDTYRVDEILAEIRRDLDFLTTTWADVPERQRSLRATFDYSWRLLNDEERMVMRALAVFQGGFTREAAREICGAAPQVLLNLSRKSLVQPTPIGRFYLHELVRQFAEERLAADPKADQDTRARHSRYYLKKLHGWGEGLKGPHQRETLETLDLEASNARAAWDWAVETAAWEPLAEGFAGFGMYYQRRARREEGLLAFRNARKALKHHPEGAHGLLLAWIWMWECWFIPRYGHGSQEAFEHHVQACHATLVGPEANPDATKITAHLAYLHGLRTWRQDLQEAIRWFLQCERLAESVQDLYLSGQALLRLCMCYLQLGLQDESDTFTQRALAAQRRLENPLGLSEAMRYRAGHLLQTGYLDEAISMEEEALALVQATGVISPGWVGTTYLVAGQIEKSLALYKKAHADEILQGNPLLIAAGQVRLGAGYLWAGNFKKARQHLEISLEMYQKYTSPRVKAGALMFFGMVELVEGENLRAFRYMREGIVVLRAMEVVAEFNFPSAFLACAAFHAGDTITLQEAVLEGLVNCTRVRRSPFLGWGLASAALMAVEKELHKEAVSLYAAALQYPFTANAHFTGIVFGKPISEAAQACLPPDEITRAETHGRACDPYEAAQDLIARYSQD